MNKRNLIVVIVAVAALVAAYGTGRFTAPSKVEEKEASKETKVAETTTTKTEAPVRKVTVTRRRPAPENPVPAGCPACAPIEEMTTTEERGPVVTTTEKHEESSLDKSRSVLTEREYPRLTLGLGVASLIVRDPLDLKWAAHANYRAVGPFGVWATGIWAGRESLIVAGLSVTF